MGREAARNLLDIDSAIRQHEYRLEKIFRAFYTYSLRLFGNYARSHIGKSGALPLQHKWAESEFNNYVQTYIASKTARKVAEISRTTKKQIKHSIAEGTADNLSYNEIAANIVEKTSGTIGRSRAMTIARTEVHETSQSAQFEAIQETGLHVTKEWLAVSDARTRDDHREADGQEQNMEDPFIIGDEHDELMHPGDPDGPANQVINCRCICLFNTK